jgi:hypothetical protein
VEDLNGCSPHRLAGLGNSAVAGQGVFETLKVVCKQVIAKTG